MSDLWVESKMGAEEESKHRRSILLKKYFPLSKRNKNRNHIDLSQHHQYLSRF